MKTAIEKEVEYIFYRQNAGAPEGDIPTRLTERECRVMIAVSNRDVERAIKKLKAGTAIYTTYATYTAEKINDQHGSIQEEFTPGKAV